MVVLAIIITLTGIVFTSQSSFNKTLELANTAYDVALTLRSAETYGMGSRIISGPSNTGYGIHFEIGNTFILFEDKDPAIGATGGTFCHTAQSGHSSGPDVQPGNCIYDGSNELVHTYTLGNGIKVSALKADNTSNVGSLDIVFARPNPDSFIRADGSTYNSACITLVSPQGGSRLVRIASSGMITVSNATSCP
jgi:Tfp pilus assembly protein FimT